MFPILTIAEAIRIQTEQLDYYCASLSAEQAAALRTEVTSTNGKAKTGSDIARGTDIEKAVWKARGKTLQEYSDYVRSMD